MQNSSNLRYRFGFFSYLSNDPCRFKDDLLQDWKKESFDQLTIYRHPEVTLKNIQGTVRSLIIVGTIYSVTGYDINLILQEFASNNQTECGEFLEKVSGRFALFVIDKNHNIELYHDAFGSRSIFYSESNPGFAASHAGLLANILGIQKESKVVDFLSRPEFRARSVKYLPADFSLWTGVRSLIPNNFLKLESSRCIRYWPTRHRRLGTFREFFGSYDLHIKGLIESLRGSSVILGITGGIDTRAVFSAMHKYSLPFSGVTWRGDYVKEIEIPSIEKIIEYLKISHIFIDMKDEYSSEVADIAGLNSGSYRGKSRLTALMHRKYHSTNSTFVRGYGGEIIRGFYNFSRKPMLDFSARSMTKAYGSSIRQVEPSTEYTKFVENAFEQYRIRANYEDLERFGFEPSDIFYWEHRMGIWGSAMLNEMDSAAYSLVGMNGRALYEQSFSLPNAERLTKAILAKVTDEYCGDLSAIPYF